MSKVFKALKKTLVPDTKYDNFIVTVTVNQMTLDSTTEWNLEDVVVAVINDHERITVKPGVFSVVNCAMWIVPVNLMTNVRMTKYLGRGRNDWKYWDRTLEIAVEDIEKNHVLASLHLNLKDYVRRGPQGHQEEMLILESKHHEIRKATLWATLHWKRVREFIDYPSTSHLKDETEYSTGSDTSLSEKWNQNEETGKRNRKEPHSKSSHSYPQDDGNDDRSLMNPFSSDEEDLDRQKWHQAGPSRELFDLVEEESDQDEASTDLEKTKTTTDATTSTTMQSEKQRGSSRYERLLIKLGARRGPQLPLPLSQEEEERMRKASIASVDLDDPKYQRNWQEAVGFYPGEEDQEEEEEEKVEEEQKPIRSMTPFTEEEKELLGKLRSSPEVKVCNPSSVTVPEREQLGTMSTFLRAFGRTVYTGRSRRKPKETASLDKLGRDESTFYITPLSATETVSSALNLPRMGSPHDSASYDSTV